MVKKSQNMSSLSTINVMLCCVSFKMAFDVVHSGVTEDYFSTPFESQSIWDRNVEFRKHVGNVTEDQIFEYLM